MGCRYRLSIQLRRPPQTLHQRYKFKNLRSTPKTETCLQNQYVPSSHISSCGTQIHAELQTGQELSKRTNCHPNPFVSDPDPPQFYEWRFTPEYAGFPPRGLAAWTQHQTRECNNALENGDLYLVDVRTPGPRPPPQTGRTRLDVTSGSGLADMGEFNGNQLRKKLVNVAEAAFTKYISELCLLNDLPGG